MQRLLADAEKVSGVHYDISSLSDVYNAIHVVQTEMGITGTTAKEASETMSGSFDAMKGAAQTLIANISAGNDITDSLNALGETVSTFLFDNLFPMIGRVLQNLPNIIKKFFETAAPKIASGALSLIKAIGKGIVTYAPKLYEFLMNALQTAIQKLTEWNPDSAFSSPFMTKMANGFKKNAPKVLKALGKLALQIAKLLGILALKMLQLGGKLMLSLAKGIGKMAGKAVSAIAKVIAKLIAKAASAVGKLVSTGAQAVVKFVSGILGSIGKAASAGAQLAGKVIGAIKNGITTVASIGRNIVSGIWNGISNSLQWIKDRIKGWVGNVMEFLKKLFKIKSPSRWAEDEIGENLGLGVAVGITNTIGAVHDALKGLVPDVDYGLSLKAFEPNIGYDLDTYGDGGLMADTFSTLTYTNPFQNRDTAQQAGGTVVYNNTFNVNVNGADNPEDWASRLVRSMKMQARMA